MVEFDVATWVCKERQGALNPNREGFERKAFWNVVSLLFCATALWVLAFSFAALAQAEPVPYDFGDAPDVPYPTADAQDWVRHHLADAYWLGGNASYAVSPRFVDTLDDATFRFGIDPNGDPYFDTDITTSANTPTRTAFLNVLVDEEARSCFQIDPFAWTQPGNHVVRNQRLELVPGTTQVYRVPAEHFVNNFVLGWIRLTLSERPVNVVPPETWDGSEDLAFLLGETEDHCGVPHFAPLLSPPALPEQEGVPQDAECDCFQRALSLFRNHVSVLQQVDVALDELLEPFWSQLRSAPDFDAALSHLAAAIAQANTFVDEAARFAEQCAEAETIRTGAETLAEKILEIQTDILNAQDAFNNNDILGAETSVDSAIQSYLTGGSVFWGSLLNSPDQSRPSGVECTELDLIKTSNPASVSPGDTFTYSITITNVGSLALQEVQVWDALPPTTTFVSATHGCQPGFIGHGQGVFCDLGALAVGESITIEIAVKAADDFTGTIVNQASACEFVSGRLGFACASGDVITTVAGAGSDVSFPDLIVQETSFDANCTLSITIQNIGNGFYNGPIDVSLTSVETPPGSGSFGTVVVTQFVTLNPKGETTFFLTGVKAENDTLTITIDPDGKIDESDESNNTVVIQTPKACRAPDPQQPAKPDVRIQDLTITDAEDGCSVTLYLLNHSTEPLEVSIGSVETPSGSGNYGTVTVTLKPGASTVTFSGLKYEGEEATITLDPSGLIDESDESNNSFTIETPASCRASSGNCEEAERDKDLLSARLATVSIAVASVDGLLTPETLNPAKSQVNRAIRDLEGLGDDIEDLFSAHTPAAQRALQEARQLYGNALNALERALDKIEQAIKTSRNPEGRHIVESLLEEASKLLQQADLALNRLDFEIFKFDVCG